MPGTRLRIFHVVSRYSNPLKEVTIISPLTMFLRVERHFGRSLMCRGLGSLSHPGVGAAPPAARTSGPREALAASHRV